MLGASSCTARSLDTDYSKHLEIALEAAAAAGAVILSAFSKPKIVEHKGEVDLVTETDKQVESLIFEILRDAYPDFKFIGEESSSSSSLSNEPTWMVDPLDGTTNFVHGFPYICTSIALVVERQVVVGVVHNPILNETFAATIGKGATLNGKSIGVSGTQSIGKSLLCGEVGYARDSEVLDVLFKRLRAVTERAQSMRCLGSCALNLCYVACGRVDGYWEIGFGGCWDCAAGVLIVLEAGGTVQDPAGGLFDLMGRRVLACTPMIANDITSAINSCPLCSHDPPVPTSDRQQQQSI